MNWNRYTNTKSSDFYKDDSVYNGVRQSLSLPWALEKQFFGFRREKKKKIRVGRLWVFTRAGANDAHRRRNMFRYPYRAAGLMFDCIRTV